MTIVGIAVDQKLTTIFCTPADGPLVPSVAAEIRRRGWRSCVWSASGVKDHGADRDRRGTFLARFESLRRRPLLRGKFNV
ncbi:hypothetical protein B586_14200 [Mycobacterium haemophilum DSM 44634]|nr:hypothetical protein B586_14200 [Mycobacterium haemophilum DSM 44634]